MISFLLMSASYAVVLLLSLLLLLFFLASLFLLIVVVIPSYRIHRHFVSQGVNCYPFIPLIGHIRSLAKYRDEGRSIYFLEDAWRQRGKVHAITVGPNVILRINDPRYVAFALRTSNDELYHKPSFAKVTIGGILGTENVLLTEGAEHTKRRRILNPAFHHSQTHTTQQQRTRPVMSNPASCTDWTAAPVVCSLSQAI